MAEQSKKTFQKIMQESSIQPKEQLLPIDTKQKGIEIGIPKEITYQEKRVPLTPLSLKLLTEYGYIFKIEKGAGLQAHFSDMEYSEAGAEIVNSQKEIYACQTILKIDPPTQEEIVHLKEGQNLISAVQLADIKEDCMQSMMQKRINALAYEFIEDEGGSFPFTQTMSEIAGKAAVFIAAEYLTNQQYGKGELLGGISGVHPTQVVIIGAGTVAEHAAKTALGVGASVSIFDNSVFRLKNLEQKLGNRIHTSTLIPELLTKALQNADVAIGAMAMRKAESPCVVSEEMVQQMKAKSMIIDVAIDRGGNFSTSKITNHHEPVFEKFDVIHYCVPNIPSRVARTASYALSNLFTGIFIEWAKYGDLETYISHHKGMRMGTYLYKGHLTNELLGNKFNIKIKEIDFLIPPTYFSI
ncbi:MAG: alanine dehydrogenase [Bacteroidetes bacterium MED-G17]|nr:MAG: alanine dehydrogenase [Bacteroidetes bacterium TMED39]PDH52331.1 MAG: alanine dehydrogenase [Bacteroidetes bacterium MED-G17]|tara:strand:- start:1085 stop:2320 length:1236 start_codon:yes stop_codon:yes gene_type:complete